MVFRNIWRLGYILGAFLLCGAISTWQWLAYENNSMAYANFMKSFESAPLDATIPHVNDAGKRMVISGRFDPHRTKVVTGMYAGNHEGARIFTPFLLTDRMELIVDRGWIAKADINSFLKNRELPGALFTLNGVVKMAPSSNDFLTDYFSKMISKVIKDQHATNNNILDYVDLKEIQAAKNKPAPQAYIQASTPSLDEAIAFVEAPDNGKINLIISIASMVIMLVWCVVIGFAIFNPKARRV